MAADITLERAMPFSPESEQAVLGAILLDEKAFSTAAELLSAEDFYDERNRQIYLAMLSLVEEEKPIRTILLLEELRRRNRIEEAGGPAYLASLTNGLPMGLDIKHYADTIRDMSCLRQTIHKCHEAIERCYEREWRAERIVFRNCQAFQNQAAFYIGFGLVSSLTIMISIFTMEVTS